MCMSDPKCYRISTIQPIPGMIKVGLEFALSPSLINGCSWKFGRHKCLWLCKAAFFAQEKASTSQNTSFHRRVDVLVEFRFARVDSGWASKVCFVGSEAGKRPRARW